MPQQRVVMGRGDGIERTDKVYFLSSTFTYDSMYYADGGPVYAADMGWKTGTMRELSNAGCPVSVIDLRIEEEEQSSVAALIVEQPKRLFVLTVSDPYLSHQESPYYQLLFKMARYPNVVYLSRYQPVELTGRLLDFVGPGRFVVSHYPYVPERRPFTKAPGRTRRILLSGAITSEIYPERDQFYRRLRANPLLRGFVAHLWHPGYPDVGDRQTHQFVGAAYLALLSGFRFMFVSGSRYDLEFLKYSECGYAGCVPVGFPPATFPAELRDCILPIDLDNPMRSILRIVTRLAADLDARAARFAALQQELRSPRRLNSALDAFLDVRLVALSSRSR